MVCVVGTAHFNEPCQEKIWFASVPEHGMEKTRKVMVMARSLYGLKSSGAAWRKKIAETLRDMDFVLTVSDTDLYWR